jgi:Putative peptidoglycan binding domain/Lysine-specific metallo-endopeptidase
MYNQYNQQLLPEFAAVLNEYQQELFPEMEFELMRDAGGGARNTLDYNKWVQASLNQALGLKLITDGKMGAMTRSAIRNFQKKNGLIADGMIGSKTEAALKAVATPPVIPRMSATPSLQVAPPPAPLRAMVDPKKVSCANTNRSYPIFRAMGTNDPVGVLETICQRAVVMMTNTILELTRIRDRITAGDPIGFPLLSDQLAWSLQHRMLMRVEDRASWTGTGTRNAGLIIRWLTRIRDLIASRDLWFTCLESANCNATTWAWVFTNNAANRAAGLNLHRIHLCRRFWQPKAGVNAATHFEFQAQTIIHEVSHIYYNTEDSGLGPGAAECISQFIADANNSPIDPDFLRRCGGAGPSIP